MGWVKIKKENHLSEDFRRRGLNHGSLLRKRTPEKQICSPSFDQKLLRSSMRWNPKTKKLPQGRKNKRKKEQKLFPLIRDCKPPRNYERIEGSLNKGIPTQILKEGESLRKRPEPNL